MTFNTNECYVYITLPGQTEPVTAGRFTITVNKKGQALGKFVYGRSYLNRLDAVEIDPLELKLSSRVFETTALNGVFGALRDAGPDYWGRLVIEKFLRKPALSEMDYLLYAPDDRAGALSFGINQTPPAPKRNFNQTMDLEKLQNIANKIINDEEYLSRSENNQIENLMLIGTSMGGARPKAIVEDSEGLWIAKFNRPDDKWNNARVEHAMLVLARNCGLVTSESQVVTVAGRDVLLVKRFDREKVKNGYLRSRMISALTLLRAEDTANSRHKWSYIFLAEELRRICTKPEENAIELFRRMCFNALISNTDDHPRNHALIAKENTWKLSPAYDLTPGAPISLEHRDLALICGNEGRYANKKNLLSQCARFLLKPDEAKLIIATMETKIRNTWYSVARSVGVSELDCQQISAAFVYPGFHLNQ